MSRVVVSACAIVVVCTGRPTAQPAAHLQLIFASEQLVPPAIREAAENEAAEIWRPYGVVLSRSLPGCGVAAASLLVAFALDGAPGDGHGGLGAIRFTAGGAPDPRVTINYRPVAKLAAMATVMGWTAWQWPAALRDQVVARVLGRTLAHEIGHFVLRSPHHPDAGLMRARQAASALAASTRKPFGLTQVDRDRLRIALQAPPITVQARTTDAASDSPRCSG